VGNGVEAMVGRVSDNVTRLLNSVPGMVGRVSDNVTRHFPNKSPCVGLRFFAAKSNPTYLTGMVVGLVITLLDIFLINRLVSGYVFFAAKSNPTYLTFML